jgi:two-component system chemotaxis response regulator CheY
VSGAESRDLKVLLVEGNKNFRQLVKAILNAVDVDDIREEENAYDSINALREFRADVCLVDWRLDEMDGLDFARYVRQSPDSPNPYVPLIMMTSHFDTKLVSRARDAGFDEFLAKPISAKSLMARISSVVRRPRSFVRSPGYFGPERRRRSNQLLVAARRRSD